MGVFDFLLGKKKIEAFAKTGDTSMAEISRVQEELLSKLKPEDAKSNFNEACRLLPKGKFAEAAAMFEAIKNNLDTDAHTVANCYNQIGACQYMLGNYEGAIANYTTSIEKGFAADKADYNLWEAYETLYNNTKDKSYPERYIVQMPDGEYVKKAQKMLQS